MPESQGIDVLHPIRPQLRDQDQQHYSYRKVPYHRAIRQINRQILVRFVRTQKIESSNNRLQVNFTGLLERLRHQSTERMFT